MNFKKIGLTVASSALVASTFVIPQVDAQAATINPGGCGDVHIITANGTGMSGRNKFDNPNGDFMMRFMVDKAREDNPTRKITNHDINYPGAAGAIHSFKPTEDNSATFGLSRLEGDMNGLDHVKEYMSRCPNTMLAFAGYSQGASVIGDLVALIANGAVEGVGSDKILGAILFADPGRSGASSFRGPQQDVRAWIPQPPNAIYQRNGESASSQNRNTVGWTGQRSLPFTGIEGRVISICNDRDLACASVPNSAHRAIADFSDKNIWPNVSYRKGGGAGQLLIKHPEFVPILLKLVPGILTNKNYTNFLNGMERDFINTQANDLDKGVMINAVRELKDIFKLLKRDDMYGSGVNDRAILIHAASMVYPSYKDTLKRQFNVPDEQLLAIEAGLFGVGLISGVPVNVSARVTPQIRYIADFGAEHGTYFSNRRISYEGLSGNSWGAQALSTGIKNYFNNSGYTIRADAGNRQLEVAEPNRADDGLRALLNYTTQGISVLGEDVNDYPHLNSDGQTVSPTAEPGEEPEVTDNINPSGEAQVPSNVTTLSESTSTSNRPGSYLDNDSVEDGESGEDTIGDIRPDRESDSESNTESTISTPRGLYNSQDDGTGGDYRSRLSANEYTDIDQLMADLDQLEAENNGIISNEAISATPTVSATGDDNSGDSTSESVSSTTSSAVFTASAIPVNNKDKAVGPSVNTGGKSTSLYSRIMSIFV